MASLQRLETFADTEEDDAWENDFEFDGSTTGVESSEILVLSENLSALLRSNMSILTDSVDNLSKKTCLIEYRTELQEILEITVSGMYSFINKEDQNFPQSYFKKAIKLLGYSQDMNTQPVFETPLESLIASFCCFQLYISTIHTRYLIASYANLENVSTSMNMKSTNIIVQDSLKEIMQMLNCMMESESLRNLLRQSSHGKTKAHRYRRNYSNVEEKNPSQDFILTTQVSIIMALLIHNTPIEMDWISICKICLYLSRFLQKSYHTSLPLQYASLSSRIANAFNIKELCSTTSEAIRDYRANVKKIEQENNDWEQLEIEAKHQRVLSANATGYQQLSKAALEEEDLDEEENWDVEMGVKDLCKATSSVTTSSLSTAINLKDILFFEDENSHQGDDEYDNLLEYLDQNDNSCVDEVVENEYRKPTVPCLFILDDTSKYSITSEFNYSYPSSSSSMLLWISDLTNKHLVKTHSTSEQILSIYDTNEYNVFDSMEFNDQPIDLNVYETKLLRLNVWSKEWIHRQVDYCFRLYRAEKSSHCVSMVRQFFDRLSAWKEKRINGDINSLGSCEYAFYSCLSMLYLLGKLKVGGRNRLHQHNAPSLVSETDLLQFFHDVESNILNEIKDQAPHEYYKFTMECLKLEIDAHCLSIKYEAIISEDLSKQFFDLSEKVMKSYQLNEHDRNILSGRAISGLYYYLNGYSPLTLEKLFERDESESDNDSQLLETDEWMNYSESPISPHPHEEMAISSKMEINKPSEKSTRIWKMNLNDFPSFNHFITHHSERRRILLLHYIAIDKDTFVGIRIALAVGLCFISEHEFREGENILFEVLCRLDHHNEFSLMNDPNFSFYSFLNVYPLIFSEMGSLSLIKFADALIGNNKQEYAIGVLETNTQVVRSRHRFSMLLDLHRRLAVLNRDCGYISKALHYYHIVRDMSREGENLYEVGFMTEEICNLLIEDGKIEKAKEDLKQTIQYFQQESNSFKTCNTSKLNLKHMLHMEPLQLRLGILCFESGYLNEAIHEFNILFHSFGTKSDNPSVLIPKKIALLSWLSKCYLKQRKYDFVDKMMNDIIQLRNQVNTLKTYSKAGLLNTMTMNIPVNRIEPCLPTYCGIENNLDLYKIQILNLRYQQDFLSSLQRLFVLLFRSELILKGEYAPELGELYYLKGKILYEASEHNSIQFPMEFHSKEINPFLHPMEQLTSKIKYGRCQTLLKQMAYSTSMDLRQACIESFQTALNIFEKCNSLIYISKVSCRMSRILLDYPFLHKAYFSSLSNDSDEFISMFYPSSLNDEALIMKKEMIMMKEFSLPELEKTIRVGFDSAIRLCSPILLLDSLLNMMELCFLQENEIEAIGHWYDARDLFLNLFTQGPFIPILKHASYSMHHQIERLLRRFIRFLTCCEKFVINNNLFMIELYLYVQYDIERYESNFKNDPSSASSSSFFSPDQFQSFLLQSAEFKLKEDLDPFCRSNRSQYRMNLKKKQQRPRHARMKSDGFTLKKDTLMELGKVYCDKNMSSSNYFQTFPPRKIGFHPTCRNPVDIKDVFMEEDKLTEEELKMDETDNKKLESTKEKVEEDKKNEKDVNAVFLMNHYLRKILKNCKKFEGKQFSEVEVNLRNKKQLKKLKKLMDQQRKDKHALTVQDFFYDSMVNQVQELSINKEHCPQQNNSNPMSLLNRLKQMTYVLDIDNLLFFYSPKDGNRKLNYMTSNRNYQMICLQKGTMIEEQKTNESEQKQYDRCPIVSYTIVSQDKTKNSTKEDLSRNNYQDFLKDLLCFETKFEMLTEQETQIHLQRQQNLSELFHYPDQYFDQHSDNETNAIQSPSFNKTGKRKSGRLSFGFLQKRNLNIGIHNTYIDPIQLICSRYCQMIPWEYMMHPNHCVVRSMSLLSLLQVINHASLNLNSASSDMTLFKKLYHFEDRDNKNKNEKEFYHRLNASVSKTYQRRLMKIFYEKFFFFSEGHEKKKIYTLDYVAESMKYPFPTLASIHGHRNITRRHLKRRIEAIDLQEVSLKRIDFKTLINQKMTASSILMLSFADLLDPCDIVLSFLTFWKDGFVLIVPHGATELVAHYVMEKQYIYESIKSKEKNSSSTSPSPSSEYEFLMTCINHIRNEYGISVIVWKS